jgi:hypothetical protein
LRACHTFECISGFCSSIQSHFFLRISFFRIKRQLSKSRKNQGSRSSTRRECSHSSKHFPTTPSCDILRFPHIPAPLTTASLLQLPLSTLILLFYSPLPSVQFVNLLPEVEVEHHVSFIRWRDGTSTARREQSLERHHKLLNQYNYPSQLPGSSYINPTNATSISLCLVLIQ